MRPEFIRLGTDGQGIPARVLRVEDVGRHKIVRLDVDGTEVSALAGESETVPTDVDAITFAPEGVNVYADDWRITALDLRLEKAAR